MSVIRQDDSVGKLIATQTIGNEEYQKSLIADESGQAIGTVDHPAVVAVSNLPETQPVSGTVAVSNLPETQPVSGTVAVSNLPETQPVSGTVAVNNFPATQPVSGTVAVSNLPETQPVSGPLTDAELRAAPVPTMTVKSAITTGTLATVGDVVVCDIGHAQGVTFGTTGTYTGLTCAFEASVNGEKWYAITAQRLDAAVARAATLAMGAVNHALIANVQGFVYFRVRCSARTSGSAEVWIAPTDAPALPGEPTSSAVTLATTTLNGSASYGHSAHHTAVSAAGLNETSVKATTGTMGGLALSNTTSAWRFVKLYAKASAPVVGTDAPVLIYGLPPQTTITLAVAAGQRLASGIAYAITAAADPMDTTPVGAGEVIVNLSYT